ncbi:class I SAM-dependent methyltransferase [Novosphingobium sp. KCTC 2891]|uniref:class I SAM-dependent methyltransferase n=1 Tax=Novosphingobium sp. KCTC 2891 TaxID=2989730 RepID=UPI0022212B98|nr:class I SAM-dependent methyltransferase [Novosphingobium sp. KCTC 2891]MCW1382924.1 class I SAM-dependent methyltransferase [Novosphingobium sp. KCTC 2891]
MTDARDWEGGVGRNWAAEWQRTDRSFAALTPRLLECIAQQSGVRVVDIGCGAGELSIGVARARPHAHVTGIDLSQDLLAVAAARAEGVPNVSFERADASRWIDPDRAPDLYVSRHGVMFFDDPPAAFAHLARASMPGARLVFSCFRAVEENGWAAEISRLLPPAPPPSTPVGPYPPGPFAFADPEHVRHCLAGWKDIAFTPFDFSYVAGSGESPVADALAFFQRIGPAAFAIRTLPDSARASFEKRLEELVRSRLAAGQVTFPSAVWLVTATADHR